VVEAKFGSVLRGVARCWVLGLRLELRLGGRIVWPQDNMDHESARRDSGSDASAVGYRCRPGVSVCCSGPALMRKTRS
jgi:hypothetical protein